MLLAARCSVVRAERDAALIMLEKLPGVGPVTVGGDKGFDTRDFIGVFKPTEWLPATKKHFLSFAARAGYGPCEGRYGFHGETAPDDVKLLYLQKRLPSTLLKRGAANPLRYGPDPESYG
jgi:hypothetical protein